LSHCLERKTSPFLLPIVPLTVFEDDSSNAANSTKRELFSSQGFDTKFVIVSIVMCFCIAELHQDQNGHYTASKCTKSLHCSSKYLQNLGTKASEKKLRMLHQGYAIFVETQWSIIIFFSKVF